MFKIKEETIRGEMQTEFDKDKAFEIYKAGYKKYISFTTKEAEIIADMFSSLAWTEQQKKIDELEEQLKPLRSFAKHALDWGEPLNLEYNAVELGLWDRKRNPTKLLTGEE